MDGVGGIERAVAIAVAALLALILLIGCAYSRPTDDQYHAAQQVIAAADAGQLVDPDVLKVSHDIVEAYEGEGRDWMGILLAAGGAILGVPALGARGRSLISVGLRALAKGDVKTALNAVVAYPGTKHSNGVLSGEDNA